jgi:hypothetical protein
VEAHGEEKPAAPNKSASGRAKNRRVELVLWPGPPSHGKRVLDIAYREELPKRDRRSADIAIQAADQELADLARAPVRLVPLGPDDQVLPAITPVATATAPRKPRVRSSNLSVAKRFTQADEDDFLVRAFEFMTQFFEASVWELGARNPDISARFRRIDANRFTAAAYRNGRKESACTIWTGGETFGGGINYRSNDTAATNSLNESLHVETGDHDLHFKLGLFSGISGERDRKFTMEQAAEHLWEKFLEPLQR